MYPNAARLLFVLCALLALSGCAGLATRDPVRVNLVGLEPLQGEGFELRFALKLRVQNPNDHPIDYDGLALQLDVNDRTFATGVSDARGSVPRFGETVLSIPVSISAFSVMRQAWGVAGYQPGQEVPYVLRGKLADGLFGTADDSGSESGGMATWKVVKAQARDILGINLTDADVHNVPLLATDAYGQFIRGANGFPMLVMAGNPPTQVEGDPDNPISTQGAVRTGHAFLDDIAHSANLVNSRGQLLAADGDSVVNGDLNGNGVIDNGETPVANGTYDDELLAEHFVAGDGRANENIGLTSIHDVFHAEHNRVLEEITGFLTLVQTASIVIGNSGNNLIDDLGFAENNTSTSAVLGSVVVGPVSGGNLVINGTTIAIANNSTLDQVVAAINLSGQANRTSARVVQETLLPPLLEASRQISALLAVKGGT